MKNLSLVGLAAYLYWFAQYQWTLKAILWLVAWIWSGGYRLAYITYHTWRRDLRYTWWKLVPIILFWPKIFRQTALFRENSREKSNILILRTTSFWFLLRPVWLQVDLSICVHGERPDPDQTDQRDHGEQVQGVLGTPPHPCHVRQLLKQPNLDVWAGTFHHS